MLRVLKILGTESQSDVLSVPYSFARVQKLRVETRKDGLVFVARKTRSRAANHLRIVKDHALHAPCDNGTGDHTQQSKCRLWVADMNH